MADVKARRTGIIAKKIGMTQIFNKDSKALAVTLLKVDGNVVVTNKTQEKDGYNSVVIGFDEAKANRVSKSIKGIYAKHELKPNKIMKEFRVSKSGLLESGKEISINHYVEDQLIDIHGITTGKGFAGPMKRWNFRGLEASHGVSISHRSHGSTGQRQDPGKTFKGKKMAGHLGAESITVQNVKIVYIDEELGIIAVHGSIPGKRGSYLTITDSVKTSLPANVEFPAAYKNVSTN